MFVSPYLGLAVWNSSTDPYSSTDLANNWAKVDQHDHSNGKGVQIGTAGIQDASITAAKLAPGTLPPPSQQQPVGSSMIVAGAVGATQLANGAVGPTQLATLPQGKLKNTGSQSCGGGVSTTLTYPTVSYSSGITATIGTTPLTCITAGLYYILFEIVYIPSYSYYGGDQVVLKLLVNNTTAAQTTHEMASRMAGSGGLGANIPSGQVAILTRLSGSDTIKTSVTPYSYSTAVVYSAVSAALLSP